MNEVLTSITCPSSVCNRSSTFCRSSVDVTALPMSLIALTSRNRRSRSANRRALEIAVAAWLATVHHNIVRNQLPFLPQDWEGQVVGCRVIERDERVGGVKHFANAVMQRLEQLIQLQCRVDRLADAVERRQLGDAALALFEELC